MISTSGVLLSKQNKNTVVRLSIPLKVFEANQLKPEVDAVLFHIHSLTPRSVVHTFRNRELARGSGSEKEPWLSQMSAASSLPVPTSLSIKRRWEFTQLLAYSRIPGNRLCRQLG